MLATVLASMAHDALLWTAAAFVAVTFAIAAAEAETCNAHTTKEDHHNGQS